MTKLLVSVRNAEEAALVLERQVDYLDVKEPTHGALGRVSPRVLEEIAGVTQGYPDVTLSAALGELLQVECGDWRPPARVDLYKVGLSACQGLDWQARLDVLRTRLETVCRRASLVCAVYGDERTARAPPAWEVLEYAARYRQPYLLLDTFDKSAGGLLDWLGESQIAGLLAEAQAAGLRVAVAGGLNERDIAALLPLGPDIVAVRGAACVEGDRQAGLDPDRVDALVRLVEEMTHDE